MNKIKQYIWVFEWIAGAILLALAITFVIKDEFVIYAFGSMFVVFGLFRLVPLIKTTESKLMKWLNAAEIVVDVTVGILMFVLVDKIKGSVWLGYLTGGILYLRGFMHFLGTSVKNEPTTMLGFLVSIAFLTIGSVIIARGGFSSKTLAWFFFVIILICVALLVWRGAIDYRNYRGNLVGTAKTKKLKKVKEKEVETNPTSDEIKINIIPEDNIDKDRPQEEITDDDRPSAEV